MLHVAPIIHRNSPLPARRSEFFSTLYQQQTAVHVVVVQGEGAIVSENRLIGSFLFELHQPCPKGSRCEIQLTYDVNGMVHVLAKQLDTENEAEAQFDSRTGEVIGWRRLHAENKDHFNDNPLLPEMFGGRDLSTENQDDEIVPTVVLNGLLARARRHLASTPEPTSVNQQIEQLIATYEKLLLNAKDGLDNDAEIDFIETRLIEFLEGNTLHD
jgi:molecular chaperone DnaK (HSP70)